VYQGHDYRFCTQEVVRADGLANCQAAGMDAVRVDSAEENAFLLQQLLSRAMLSETSVDVVFLGGNDLAQSGSWAWTDGTVFWNTTSGAVAGLYSNWSTLPKVGGVAHCVIMTANGTWGPRSCNSGNATIVCESL
jgi:hypothetical protein